MKRVLAVTVLASLFVSAPAMAANKYRTLCEDPSYMTAAWRYYLSSSMMVAMKQKMEAKGVSWEQVKADSGNALMWGAMKKVLLASKNAKLYKEEAEYAQGYGEFMNGNTRMIGGEPIVYGPDGTAFCSASFQELDSGESFKLTYSVDLDDVIMLADRDKVMAYAERLIRLPM